jgi:hypothetical protein
MEIRWFGLLAIIFWICLARPVFAQTANGYDGPIEKDTSSLNGNLPQINLPEPGWSPVLDLKTSDGTASVPRCDDPAVIATVRDGIMGTANSQYRANGGSGDLVTQATLGPVWVHPSNAGGFVCDMHVQTDVPMTGADDWKFQTFSQDGTVMVFFMDADGQ